MGKKNDFEGLAGLFGAMSLGGDEDNFDHDIDHVAEAVNRPVLSGLVRGDKVRGVKRGIGYMNKSQGNPVVFIRYLTDDEKVAYNAPDSRGSPLGSSDMVISYFLDRRDGEMIKFCIDSSFYEKC